MTPDRDLLDEHVLRRALRLDAAEMPPRLDHAVIAAAARASDARLSSGIVATAVVAFVGGWIWSGIFASVMGVLLTSAGVDPVGLAIDAIDAGLLRLAPIAEIATAPVVPIAIVVAAGMAAFFEHTKGRTDATPS